MAVARVKNIREMTKNDEEEVYFVFTTFLSSIKKSTFRMLISRMETLKILFCLSLLVYLCHSSETSVVVKVISSILISGILIVLLYKYEANIFPKNFEKNCASEMQNGLFSYWGANGRKMLVAVSFDEKLVGIVGIDRTNDPGICEIKRMTVVPEYQRMGLGKKLLRSAEQTAKTLGYTKIVLHTGQFQPAAVKLYISMKYQPLPLADADRGFITTRYKVHPFEKYLNLED